MTRREFIHILPLTGAGAAAHANDATPRLRFGVIADCQYADAEINTQLNRHYRLSPKKLDEAVAALNRSELDFVVNLGDSIDRDVASFGTILPIFRKLKAPCRHAIGNHDYDVADEFKRSIPGRFGLDTGTFFSWNAKGWRFVMLDGNDISLFAHPQGSAERAAAENYRASFNPAPPDYNAAIGAAQLRWLRAELDAARLHKEKAIIFCHYPIHPSHFLNLWNADEVLKTVLPFQDVVAAWMNGHNHDGHYGKSGTVHFVTFKGMVDTTENTWAVVDVHADRIEITGFKREASRNLAFV
jgi:hypothetical protein